MIRALVLVALAGCSAAPAVVLDETPSEVLARLGPRAVDASLGPGMVRYLGFEATPERPGPGDTVTLVHYWVAETAGVPSQRVFVHALLEGARGRVPNADHDLPLPPSAWPVGKVIRDAHPLVLPSSLPAASVDLRVGLYDPQSENRLAVRGAQDAERRVLAGTFAVAGHPIPLPTYTAPHLARAPVLDGVIDDAEWGGAPWTVPFRPSSGEGQARHPTRARMAWDAQHLYLAIEAQDPDILGALARRDDPIYREEALELFLAIDHARGDYVELQVSPRGTQFDASFRGGPRRNMSTAFNARYRVGLGVEGTVEPLGPASGARDHRWTTEWAVEIASLGLSGGWHAGRALRINLLRVGKDRVDGRIVPDESAWSPPLMGDFHNLERFGLLRLAPRVAPP